MEEARDGIEREGEGEREPGRDKGRIWKGR